MKTNFDYYLVNTSDEFLNEYALTSSMKLKWLTNFTGSNGMALVGKKRNYFFTDGRYTLQAKKELDSSFKILEIPKTDFFNFARNNLVGKKILLDFRTFNYKFLQHLIKIICNRFIRDTRVCKMSLSFCSVIRQLWGQVCNVILWRLVARKFCFNLIIWLIINLFLLFIICMYLQK